MGQDYYAGGDELNGVAPNPFAREDEPPQHNLDLSFPDGRTGRYVKFSNQMNFVGWNNCLNERCSACLAFSLCLDLVLRFGPIWRLSRRFFALFCGTRRDDNVACVHSALYLGLGLLLGRDDCARSCQNRVGEALCSFPPPPIPIHPYPRVRRAGTSRASAPPRSLNLNQDNIQCNALPKPYLHPINTRYVRLVYQYGL
jgi:hypothetical protein